MTLIRFCWFMILFSTTLPQLTLPVISCAWIIIPLDSSLRLFTHTGTTLPRLACNSIVVLYLSTNFLLPVLMTTQVSIGKISLTMLYPGLKKSESTTINSALKLFFPTSIYSHIDPILLIITFVIPWNRCCLFVSTYILSSSEMIFIILCSSPMYTNRCIWSVVHCGYVYRMCLFSSLVIRYVHFWQGPLPICPRPTDSPVLSVVSHFPTLKFKIGLIDSYLFFFFMQSTLIWPLTLQF